MSTSGKTDDAKKAAAEEAAPFSTPSPGNPVMSFLQSPVPTKPAQSSSVDIAKGNLNPVETRTRTQVQNKNGASESNVVKEYSVKPYTSSTQSTSAIPSTSSSVKKLVVKQDPNLKSCLTQTPSFSTPPNNNSNNNESNNNTNSNININNENNNENNNNNNGQAGVGQNRPALTHPESEHTQHPQFLSTDNISPNNHGLGIAGKNPQTEEFAVITPSHYTPMVPNQGAKITSPPLQASSNSTNSITNTTTTTTTTAATTTTTNAPTSATSPIIGVRTQSPLSDTHEQHPVFQPSMSRMNSLRYKVDDKKYIETARHSNNNSEENLSSNLDTALEEEKSKLHLLIGITGCISIHKNVFLIIEKLFELYTHDNLEIQVILTKSAEYILSEKLHKFDEMGVRVWFSDDGWKYFLTSPFQKYYTQAVTTGNLPAFKKQFHSQNQILQQYSLVYDLQRWTDVLLLAPLSANTMAKLITGLSDNLLTDLLRIWPAPQVHYTDQNTAKQAPVKPHPHPHPHPSGEVKKDTTVISNNLAAPKPIISALALTNSMYSHPITKRQLVQLQETYPNMSILKPVEKCVDMDGNIAMGGMRSWREVVDFVCKKLGPPPEDEDEDEDEEEGDNDREEANDIDAILEENDDDEDDDDDEEEEEEEDTSETV